MKNKELIKMIDADLKYIDYGCDVLNSYLEFETFPVKTEYAVAGILLAYRKELESNSKEYKKNPSKEEEALVKIKTIDCFIKAYGIKKAGNFNFIHLGDQCVTGEQYADFERDAKIVCERFENIYSAELKEIRTREENDNKRREQVRMERKEFLDEKHLKNL